MSAREPIMSLGAMRAEVAGEIAEIQRAAVPFFDGSETRAAVPVDELRLALLRSLLALIDAAMSDVEVLLRLARVLWPRPTA